MVVWSGPALSHPVPFRPSRPVMPGAVTALLPSPASLDQVGRVAHVIHTVAWPDKDCCFGYGLPAGASAEAADTEQTILCELQAPLKHYLHPLKPLQKH